MLFSALQNSRCLMQLKPNQLFQSVSYASKLGKNSIKPVGSILCNHSIEELKEGLFIDGSTKVSNWAFETEKLSQFKNNQISSKGYATKSNIQSSKPRIVRPGEVFDEVIATSTGIHENEPKLCLFDHDVWPEVLNRKNQQSVTFLIFDLETTGFSKEKNRIIQIAFRDLSGGVNSTFETLVNPECFVTNSSVHKITYKDVNRPEVPKFKELLPILLQYIESRRIPGVPLILVAHNARGFDVPFLISEFRRCSAEIPPDYRFFDSLPIAREKAKLEGPEKIKGAKLEHLREHYGIENFGEAHNAMTDVHTLAMVLEKLTHDLKLTPLDLLDKSFTALDVINASENASMNNTKKKKKTKMKN